MPNFNEKTLLTTSSLRSLGSRIAACAEKFESIAKAMDDGEIDAVLLATDTFRDTTLKRLEAFTRTLEREFISAKEAADLEKTVKKRRATKKKGS